MHRALRIEYRGAIYHVMIRAQSNRQPVTHPCPKRRAISPRGIRRIPSPQRIEPSRISPMIITPSGRTNVFQYDAVGRKSAEILAYGTAEATTNRFEYDAVGNLTNRIDGLSNAWQTVFNVMNLPVASIDPLGRTNVISSAVGDDVRSLKPIPNAECRMGNASQRLVTSSPTPLPSA